MDLCKNPRNWLRIGQPHILNQLNYIEPSLSPKHCLKGKQKQAHLNVFCVSGAGGARHRGHLMVRVFLSPPFLPEGPCRPGKSLPSSPALVPSLQYESRDLSYPKEATGLQWKPPAAVTLMLPESARYLSPLSVPFLSCLVNFVLG